jgi:hypothetical protein
LVCGSERSTVSAPRSISASTVRTSAARMSSSIASKYSCGSPMRSPRTSPVSPSLYGGTGASSEVESRASNPAMVCSTRAASATVRVSGPTWSSDDANATTPQRETRP